MASRNGPPSPPRFNGEHSDAALDEIFARATPLGGFASALGAGQLALERVGDTLRVYLRTTDGFSFANNPLFRELFDAARGSAPSEAVFDDPRTVVRFVIGPNPWSPGDVSKSVDVKPASAKYAWASIAIADLKAITNGKGLAMYAEISSTNWHGGTNHSFLNLDGRSFSNFEIPRGLIE